MRHPPAHRNGCAWRIANSGLDIHVGASRYRLQRYGADDFMTFPTIADSASTLTITAIEILRVLEVVAFAGTSSARSYLRGICVDRINDGDLVAVATDGVILARVALPGAAKTLPQDDNRSFIMPTSTVEKLHKAISRTKPERVTLHRSKTLISVQAPTFRLSSKLIDARYPDYARVIPLPSANVVICDKAALLGAVARLAAVATTDSPAAALSWCAEHKVLRMMLAREPDNAMDPIEDVEVSGAAAVVVGLDQLRKVIGELHDKRVRIEVNGPGPLRVESATDQCKTALLMPLRWNLDNRDNFKSAPTET